VNSSICVGTKVGIRLHRNRNELVLMVDPTNPVHLKKGYQVVLKTLQLEVLRVRLTPETISILETSLAKTAAKYFFPRM